MRLFKKRILELEKRIFKKRIWELENWMLTHFEWNYVSRDDIEKLGSSIISNGFYNGGTAGKILNTEAIGLFKKICSQIGISYYDVEELFKKQNQDFFELTEHLMHGSERNAADEGAFYKRMFRILIVPKLTNAEKLLNKFRKLSPEEQAEILQLFAHKKIKITVEDI